MMRLALVSPFDPAEWWQLWTCHLIHWTAGHLLLNAIAMVPPIVLAPRRVLLEWMWRALIAAPLLSVVLLASGFRGEYRGASGLVVMCWVFAGVALVREHDRRSGLLLLCAIGAKLGLGAFGLWPAASHAFVTVAAMHYAGAAAGVLAAVTVRSREWQPSLAAEAR